MELTNISTIRAMMEQHGARFSKTLGQNFLTNPTVCPRMVEASGITTETGVLEIGPGIGVLTTELAKHAKKVVAIELDSTFIPILQETLAPYHNVTVLQGDALKINLGEVLAEQFAGMPVAVCANLPYYITSPFIMRLLEDKLPITSITALIQKEAAERICAPLPSRAAGAVTVSVAYYATPHILFPVSRGSFMPVPNVDSSVIQLIIRPAPPFTLEEPSLFFKLVRTTYAQRRKTLVNTISGGFQLPKEAVRQLLAQAEIPATARPEELSLTQFGALANGIFAFQ